MARDTKSRYNPLSRALTGTKMLGSGIEPLPLTTRWLMSVTFALGAVTTAPSAESSTPRTWTPRMPLIDPRPNGTESNRPSND